MYIIIRIIVPKFLGSVISCWGTVPSNSRFRLRLFFFSISTKPSLQSGNMPLIYIYSTTHTNFHYFNSFKVFVRVQSTCQIIHAITLLLSGGFLNEISPGCIELWRFSLSRSGFIFEAGS